MERVGVLRCRKTGPPKAFLVLILIHNSLLHCTNPTQIILGVGHRTHFLVPGKVSLTKKGGKTLGSKVWDPFPLPLFTPEVESSG